MRQLAAFAILVALFILLVGTRFKPSDGDKLAAISRLAVGKVRGALPPASTVAAPVHALRQGLPETLEDRVKDRLSTDTRFQGLAFEVSSEGARVTIRGVVPDAELRQAAVRVAEHTTGVEALIDELVVPEN